MASYRDKAYFSLIPLWRLQEGLNVHLTAIVKCFQSAMLVALTMYAGAQQLSPEIYFEKAFQYIKEASVFSDRVDWEQQRERVEQALGQADTIEDTYPLIRQTVQALGDGHSQFYTPREIQTLLARVEKNQTQPAPEGRFLEESIGYTNLPAHSGEGVVQGSGQYANVAQTILKNLDEQGVCGWVVDLRENDGGNPYVMLAGVGPLLGEGKVGAFVYADGERVPWYYRDGRILLGEKILSEVKEPYTLSGIPPVAVLLSPRTASAAEAVAIAFKERPNTRSFGAPTDGVPTGLQSLAMPDGAQVSVTVAFMADRTGRPYDSFIEPDSYVWDVWNPRQPQADLVLEAAYEWLSEQPQCLGNVQD